MKLAMFSPRGMDLQRGWPGRVDGDRVVQLAAQTLQVYFTAGGALREHAEYPLAQIELRAPVLYPPAVRLFGDGGEFVFGNSGAIVGPEQEVAYPQGARELLSGPALVAVIGEGGAIGGFTAGNAWTAPDLAGAKRYDFALSIGPVLVTADDYEAEPEWEERRRSAALNTVLRPGDLLVQRLGDGRAVSRGEIVEIDVPAIGVLRNVVV